MENIISAFKRFQLTQLFTIGLRYLLGASFVFASIFKIRGIRFTPNSGESSPINSLPHFFEAMYQSGFYWKFIGWGQLVAGFLLMTQIFSTLGALAFLPVIINIVVITVSFESTNVLIIAVMMLMANVYLLLWDWNKLKFIILSNPGAYVDDNQALSKRRIWIYGGILLFVIIIFGRTEI